MTRLFLQNVCIIGPEVDRWSSVSRSSMLILLTLISYTPLSLH